jgi:hypothetical protein
MMQSAIQAVMARGNGVLFDSSVHECARIFVDFDNTVQFRALSSMIVDEGLC